MKAQAIPDPQVTDLLARIARSGHQPFWELEPAAARAAYAKGAHVLDIAAAALARVDDFSIRARDGSDLALRVYVPRRSATPLPATVFFHGGGFTIGGIDTHDAICRMLSRDADCIVVSVDYRRAPEWRFPTAVEDAWDAVCWVYGNAQRVGVDATRIALAGDSAGGTLATVCAILARDTRWRPCLQLLIYPGTCARQDTPSHRRLASGWLLDERSIQWFFSNYLRGPADRDDWRFAPLDGVPHIALEGVAPATILVAGFDPLHDEGVLYAERLRASGIAVDLLEYSGMIHGFFHFGGFLRVAKEAHRDASLALRRAFSASESAP